MWRLENPLLTVYFVAYLVVRHFDRTLFLCHVFAGISGIIVGCGIGRLLSLCGNFIGRNLLNGVDSKRGEALTLGLE